MSAEDWTDDRLATLRRLWGEGLSCAQIARELNCGFSRNAVIGKASRLHLPMRAGKPGATRARQNHPTTKRTAPPQFRPSIAAAVEPKAHPMPKLDPALFVPTVALERHHCKFPVTDNAPWMHCGQNRHGEGPYCALHTVMATSNNVSFIQRRDSDLADLAAKVAA